MKTTIQNLQLNPKKKKKDSSSIIQRDLTYQSPTDIPFSLWHIILSYSSNKTLRSVLLTCKAFYSILMINDRSLWFRAKPYIVDIEDIINNDFLFSDRKGRKGRKGWRYVPLPPQGSFCDESLPQYIQPCLDFIDTASKQRWQQVQYTNIRSLDDPWDFFCNSNWKRFYHSLWKSLDSEAILYVMIAAGDGFICLDTKGNALVAGVQGSHPAVLGMDFEYLNK